MSSNRPHSSSVQQAPGRGTVRREIRTVEMPASDSFDQHFWPIVMAMCLLAAMVSGAAVTVLNGTTMWVTLMVLPGFVAASLAAIRLVDHRWIRRSVVFAAILSLALHLFLLVMANLTYIFGRPIDAEVAQSDNNQSRPIRVTFRREQPVVEPEDQPDTPEPQIEPVERQDQPNQTLERSQTQLAHSATTQVNSSQRSDQPSQTVVRHGRSPSELSSQNQNNLPQSSELAQSTSPPEAVPNPTQVRPAQPQETSNSRQPSPTEIARTSSSDSSSSSQSARTEPNPANQPQANTSAASSTSRTESRNTPAPSSSSPAESQVADTSTPAPSAEPVSQSGASLSRVEAQTSQPSPAATIDRKSPESSAETALRNRQLPRQQTNPSQTSVADTEISRVNESSSPSSSQPAATSSTSVASQVQPTAEPVPTQPLNRQVVANTQSQRPRETQLERESTSNLPNQSDPRRNTAPATNRIAQTPVQQPRNDQPQTAPSITAAPANDPRRSPRSSPNISSPRIVESPATSPSTNQTGSSQSRPQPTAISKSSTGQAGGGSSANLQRDTSPAVSPAQVASNSSNRSQQVSQSDQADSLASQQQSQVAHTVTGAPTPQVTIPVDSPHGSISGSPAPAQQNADSSASIQTASADAERGEMSADKGQASVDVGPTKIVADNASTSRSTGGGGQPQISEQSLATSDPGQSPTTNMTPSVSTDNPNASPSSPLAQGANPVENAQPAPDSNSMIAQRPDSGTPSVGQPDHSEIEHAPTSLSVANSSGTERSERDQPATSQLAMADDNTDRERTPSTELTPQMVAENGTGSSDAEQTASNAPTASNDPSQTAPGEAIAATTELNKEQMGSMQSDRAREDSLVQANDADESRIANSSTSRRSRLGSDQRSQMIMGQSEIEPNQISPSIGNIADKSQASADGSTNGSQSSTGQSNSQPTEIARGDSGGTAGGPASQVRRHSQGKLPVSWGKRQAAATGHPAMASRASSRQAQRPRQTRWWRPICRMPQPVASRAQRPSPAAAPIRPRRTSQVMTRWGWHASRRQPGCKSRRSIALARVGLPSNLTSELVSTQFAHHAIVM